VIVQFGDTVIGEDSRLSLGSYQKSQEVLTLEIGSKDIEVVGSVSYRWTRNEYTDGKNHASRLFIDLPVFIQKGKYKERDIRELYYRALYSTSANVSYHSCKRLREFRELGKEFLGVEVWMVRYSIDLLYEGQEEFGLQFKYSQQDLMEAGMKFNFYIPMFEDGFPLDDYQKTFSFKVHDQSNRLIGLGGVSHSEEKGKVTYFDPIPNSIVVLSLGQQAAGGDAVR